MKPILYYAKACPDTKPFVDKLNELGIVYEEVEVFDKIKGNMQIGIPCLVVSESECVLDIDKLNEV